MSIYESERSEVIVDPDSFSFHPALLAELIQGGEFPWHNVKTTIFMDRSPYAKVGVGKLNAAVVPLWMTHDIGGFTFRMQEIGNALHHEEPGYAARTQTIYYVFPYFEGRGDKITRVRQDVVMDEDDSLPALVTGDHKRMVIGETVYAELLAEAIAKPGHGSGVLLLDPHSALVHRYMEKHIPRVLTLTAVPLFADWIHDHNLVNDNTVVVSPDLGAISRAGHLAQLLRVPLVICDKWRPQQNWSNMALRYGDVRGKRVIGMDEVIDTAGTITLGADVLHEEGADEVIVLSTSAIFSGPAIARLDKAIRDGKISYVVTTDNLPSYAKGRLLGPKYQSIPIAPLLGAGIKTLLDPNATSDTYGIRSSLFRNETPEEAYIRFQGEFNLPPLEPVTS